MSSLPSIGSSRTGCACCPAKPETAPMDWQPHPGFGTLRLVRDGERWFSCREEVTFAEIERLAAFEPDHDWRLRIEGPLGGVVYQRQGCAQWVAVERLGGFA